jgi:hypothetical protein
MDVDDFAPRLSFFSTPISIFRGDRQDAGGPPDLGEGHESGSEPPAPVWWLRSTEPQAFRS